MSKGKILCFLGGLLLAGAGVTIKNILASNKENKSAINYIGECLKIISCFNASCETENTSFINGMNEIEQHKSMWKIACKYKNLLREDLKLLDKDFFKLFNEEELLQHPFNIYDEQYMYDSSNDTTNWKDLLASLCTFSYSDLNKSKIQHQQAKELYYQIKRDIKIRETSLNALQTVNNSLRQLNQNHDAIKDLINQLINQINIKIGGEVFHKLDFSTEEKEILIKNKIDVNQKNKTLNKDILSALQCLAMILIIWRKIINTNILILTQKKITQPLFNDGIIKESENAVIEINSILSSQTIYS